MTVTPVFSSQSPSNMQVWAVAAMSADGRIAEDTGHMSLDWTSKEDTQFFIKKTKEAHAVIMGRKTYETIGKPLKDRINVVMTRDTSGYEDILGSLKYTSDSPEQVLEWLKGEGHERVAVIGGSEIYSLFLRAGLLTDLFLTIEPLVFGSGVPLFDGASRTNLKLVEQRMLNDQAILLHYRVVQS